MKVKIKKLSAEAKLPFRGSAEAAGYDLSALEKVVVKPGESVAVSTGLAFELPNGHYFKICPRSSLMLKQHLSMVNSVGIIDSDYRGEVRVLLRNFSAESTATIDKHERIAQAILQKYEEMEFEEVEELSDTERGEGGIGSTGKF